MFTNVDPNDLGFDNSNSTLQLPLERTAREQINYAQWLYGGRVKQLLSEVHELEYADENEEYIQFNYAKNSFTFNHPEGWSTDEFYFLFDYLKEVYLDNGYRVTDAIKESKSKENCYKDTERYILIDSVTHHLVKLEVVSIRGKVLKIIGFGYPTDAESSRENQPYFFRIIKEVFEKQYI